MASNSRFATAIHVLGVLAWVEKMPVSSEMIASSVKTNPVVIRRIIRKLVKHGIVEVQMGTGGGSRLTRSPADISLADVYAALEEEELFQSPELGEDHCCPVGIAVRPILKDVFASAERKLAESLGKISLKDVMDRVSDRICGQGPESYTNA